MTLRQDRSLLEKAVTVVAVAFAFIVVTGGVVSLSREVGVNTPVWPANSILIFALLVMSRRQAWICLALCMALNLGLNFYMESNRLAGVWLAASNGLECVMAAALTRRALGPSLKLRTLPSFLRLMVKALLPTALFSAVVIQAVRLVWTTSSINFLDTFFTHALSLATVLTPLLLLIQPGSGRSSTEHVVLLTLLTLLAVVLFHQTTWPPTFLMTPAIALVALRLGPKGGAIGALLVGAISYPVTFRGGGPMELHPAWTAAERGHLFQAVHSVSFTLSLLAAFAVVDQTRTRHQLIRRQTIARDARRRAMAASAAKTAFLATMSHEIRTPMNSMLGFTQVLLLRHDLAAEARHQLSLIAQAGDSLLSIVNDILDFSKVEAGRLTLDPRPTDISRLAEHCLATVAEAAKAKGLEIEYFSTWPAGHQAMVDDLRLKQVLFNLLSNAVKFTASGGVSLNVGRAGDDPAGPWRFEVRDTGIGIDLDMKQQLFTRFTQADTSIARGYGGTGLGLAICKRLVELMGGRIGVESAAGAGSVFWFQIHLPLAPCAAPSQAEPDRIALGGRILLVDDHPMNRELGVKLLEILGCQVETADGGEAAVAAMRGGDYDLVLMDVHMPGVDGLAATRAIKALGDAAGRVPIVAMTADVLPEQVAACLASGMVDHVSKPIDIGKLHSAVARWMPDKAPSSV